MLYDLNEEAPRHAGARTWLDDRALRTAFLVVWAAVTLWKLALATQTNVIWEEAHFVVAGMHPDLAYPDVPAGWPLFARLCVELFGASPLAVRLPGLAVAAAIPFAVAWLARPLVGERQALWAALIACVLPPLAVSGTIFYPEGAPWKGNPRSKAANAIDFMGHSSRQRYAGVSARLLLGSPVITTADYRRGRSRSLR